VGGFGEGVVRVVGEADSFAALRNDSQKDKGKGDGNSNSKSKSKSKSKRRSRPLRDDSQKGKCKSKNERWLFF